MARARSRPARAQAKPKSGYRLTMDVLGFVQADGSRGEVEGRGRLFEDLPAEAVARGLETGALEAVGTPAPPVEEPSE